MATRHWILAFLGFFMIFGGWAFAAPFDGPPDEVQHVVRAAGVASLEPGQIFARPAVVTDGQGHPGMGAVQRVPVGLGGHASCWGFDPKQPATCAPPISGGPVEPVETSAGRYHPLYYLAVGLPLRHWPGWGGLVVARLISAALSAAFLACAFVALRRWSRHGLMLGALLACSTPMLAHLAGAVNPNGLEIAAGIAMFAAGIPLLLGPPGENKRHLLALTAVSAIVLATLRSLGPLWMVCGLFALLVPMRRDYLRQLLGPRPASWWAFWRRGRAVTWGVAVVLALVLSVAWIVGMGAGALVARDPGTMRHYGLSAALITYIVQWGNYLKGMVGVAGWFDISMWEPAYWIYLVIAGSLVVLALAVGGWTTRWRMFVLFLGGVVAPGVMQISQANVTGFIIGGRYMLPLLVGLPLLAAWVVEHSVLDARQSHSMTKLFCVFLLPAHLALLLFAMGRWQSGIRGGSLTYLNPLGGAWHPATGSALPVLLMLAGIVVTFRVFWRGPAATGPDTPWRAAEQRPGSPDDVSTDSLSPVGPPGTA